MHDLNAFVSRVLLQGKHDWELIQRSPGQLACRGVQVGYAKGASRLGGVLALVWVDKGRHQFLPSHGRLTTCSSC